MSFYINLYITFTKPLFNQKKSIEIFFFSSRETRSEMLIIMKSKGPYLFSPVMTNVIKSLFQVSEHASVLVSIILSLDERLVITSDGSLINLVLISSILVAHYET